MSRMFRGARSIGASLAAVMISGCAYVTAVPVAPGSTQSGIRIYDVKPILIVNGSTTTVSLVPNYNRPYALRFGSFLAKHDFEMTLQDGFITKLKSNQDTTAVIELLKQVAETALSPPGQTHGGQQAGGADDRFGVFEFVFSEDGSLVELRPLLDARQLARAPASAPIVTGPVRESGPRDPSPIAN